MLLEGFMKKEKDNETQVVDSLIQALKDKEGNVRSSAAYALGVIKDLRAAEPLIQALNDEDASVRRNVAEALGKTRDISAVTPLIQAFKDKDESVRRRAAEALGVIGKPAVESLILAREDKDRNVQILAAQALKVIDDVRGEETLLQAVNKQLEDYYPSYNDYLKSIDLVNSFFDGYLIPNIRKCCWNLGIRVERRGSQLYLDQKASKMDLRLLYDLSDQSIQNHLDIIKGKNIVIFDDSIKEGRNIRRILELNGNFSSAKKITVAVLLSRSDTKKKLESEFPNIKFYSEKETSKDNFSKDYLKFIQPYLDSICLPLQKVHPLLSIDLDGYFDENIVNTIIDIFNIYGYIHEDTIKKFPYVCGEKKMFEFKKETLNDLPIITNLKNLGVLHEDTILEDVVIIRLYIRGGYPMRLYMQPILVEGFMVQNGAKHISFVDNYVKSQIIYQFLLDKILPNLKAAGINISRFSVILD